MDETEAEGMQGDPSKWIGRASIGLISHDRMSHFGKMGADLILSSGFEGDFEGCPILKPPQHSPMCDGVFPRSRLGGRTHPFRAVLSQIALDGSAASCHMPLDDGPVPPLYVVPVEHILKLFLYAFGFREDQHAADKLVQSVNDKKLLAGITLLQMCAQVGIGGPFPFMLGRHGEEAGGLVNDEEISILVDYLQAVKQNCRCSLLPNINNVPAPNQMACDFTGLAVETHPSLT